MVKHLSSIGLIVAISGCATPGVNTYEYVKHDPKSVTNEIQVDEPYGKVWDKLVRELSKSFYVINNIDKESRIINLSFSSQTPSDFVDCGMTHRRYKRGDESIGYSYKVADSASFKVANGAQHPFFYYSTIRRSTTLEGRSNIYLAPVESDQTKTTVAVNARYILTINATGEKYAQHFLTGETYDHGQIPFTQPVVMSFNTNKPSSVDVENGVTITCFSNGKLEQDVLQILN